MGMLESMLRTGKRFLESSGVHLTLSEPLRPLRASSRGATKRYCLFRADHSFQWGNLYIVFTASLENTLPFHQELADDIVGTNMYVIILMSKETLVYEVTKYARHQFSKSLRAARHTHGCTSINTQPFERSRSTKVGHRFFGNLNLVESTLKIEFDNKLSRGEQTQKIVVGARWSRR